MSVRLPIIDTLIHPPLSLLKRSTTSPSVLTNPYSGSGSLVVTGTGVFPPSAFGVHWSVNTAPVGAGRTSRSILIYEQLFFSFALHYILGDGTDFIGDNVGTGAAEGFWLWEVALPSSLTYNILPGWTVHLDWLIGL